ncbi:hypothetical protein [uncultured Umboniibacter sp.]|uniref:hypothetical protein n=1 Tax=uncultured Umboniibacter sp. TaxID=1798917 RepID=UPI002609A37C|nr:hypothetical protein [uncultured Umboniibacter sp.]
MLKTSVLSVLLLMPTSQALSETIAEVNVPCDKLPSAEIDFSQESGLFTITVGRQTLTATSIRFTKLDEGINECAIELANFTFVSETPLPVSPSGQPNG